MLPKKLKNKLEIRLQENAFRQLGKSNHLIDFSSNDYLGFSKSATIFNTTNELLKTQNSEQNGATGSRLLSGNHKLYPFVEEHISTFHNSETALIFNSGYDANLGFFSCVPQRNDIVLYDEYCHASIRDGITMSKAKSFKFKHNDLQDLECHLERSREVSESHQDIYIITESVFSMDGDSPDLVTLSQISKKHNANLIIDEAHAIGVFGKNGNGLISQLKLEDAVFARTITFGKALGAHGAAILCNQDLKEYLINFSRPFIYTTALPPHSLATVKASYDELNIQNAKEVSQISVLKDNISFFKSELQRLNLQEFFIKSDSAIHSCVISGNENVKRIAQEIQKHGFDIKAILSPTVSKGKERLRFCLHSYNSSEEITKVLQLLAIFV
ncbi:aminotransferase class I/II-fold pyridoxal phosphate-dependent enzyme [Psychroserpens ponticola]|uniref:Pyridoxal phosphate-dependent aminotransferase family protein n=1 Tax=Psychroserpens ponticola TaxID=2932268 RepID=A0ABY7RWL7_9FLAO|nr:pyridoxal phosphate-dependent aminotransferase family protein [Psychroserpens ponticola]WCO01482.1 pyridoxal phosphate-dependent aminotransferase family protein [Psychroserpens ponticola]